MNLTEINIRAANFSNNYMAYVSKNKIKLYKDLIESNFD